MWKTIAFYGGFAALFGALAVGSADYTSQFNFNNSPVTSSYAKQKGSSFGITNDWARTKR